MSAPAYHFHGMTFCASCALLPTQVGFVLCGQPKPESMEDAIADLVLMNAAAGSSTEVPVAVSASGICESCGKPYGPEVTAQEEVA